MRLNKKGQSLIEFVILLPILVFVLFALIDFGLISYNKTKLEGIVVDVGSMYKNKETSEEIASFIKKNDKDLQVKFEQDDKYFKVILYKKYDFITPGLSNVLKDFQIDVERTMYYE